MPSQTAFNDVRSYYTDLVQRIRADEPAALEELYCLFQRGLRFYMLRQGVTDADDKVQEVFLAAFIAIKRGDVRDPERLAGFIHGIARNILHGALKDIVVNRAHDIGAVTTEYEQYRLDSFPSAAPSPEALFENGERISRYRKAIGAMCDRDREIITRFYLGGETAEQICTDMDLTPTQFRLFKSRAKQRLSEAIQRRGVHQSLTALKKRCGYRRSA